LIFLIHRLCCGLSFDFVLQFLHGQNFIFRKIVLLEPFEDTHE
jgi:hypothetical protein